MTFGRLHAGPELSVAATKSYLCTSGGALRLVAGWSQDEGQNRNMAVPPQKLCEARSHRWNLQGAALLQAEHKIVLGRGVGLVFAQEAALKFEETCWRGFERSSINYVADLLLAWRHAYTPAE